MQFYPNDQVCVAGMGLGKVLRIAPASGVLPERYVIETQFGITELPLTCSAPKLRAPAEGTEVNAALRILLGRRKPLPQFAHKQEKYIGAQLAQNDLCATATLLRDLYVPEGEERSSTKLTYYDKVLIIMASEVAHVLGRPLPGTRGLIESTIINRRLPTELGAP